MQQSSISVFTIQWILMFQFQTLFLYKLNCIYYSIEKNGWIVNVTSTLNTSYFYVLLYHGTIVIAITIENIILVNVKMTNNQII